MSKGLPSATFRINAKIFPAMGDLYRRLGAKKATRRTDLHPIWRRIDGNGFTIWLSEIRLASSDSEQPVWELKMEALASLPPEGKKCWEDTYIMIHDFFREAGLVIKTI
jgi:hypothetical protein